MIEFELIDSKEVWWSVTNQYEIRFDDGEILEFRAAEDPNSTEFFVFTGEGWEPLKDGNEKHDAFYEAWSDGALE